MKKLAIQFDGYEIGDYSMILGFETSREMLLAVGRGKVERDSFVEGVEKWEMELESGDILFDYETGTRWKVVEAK